MNIPLSSATSGYTLSDAVLTTHRHGTIELVHTDANGKQLRTVSDISLDTPTDASALPETPTLGDVVTLALKRQHPQYQYLAEQNGLVVQSYRERFSYAQQTERVAYGSTNNNH